MSWYGKGAASVDITVRLTPKADRDAFGGIGVLADGRAVLKVRVRALPEDGAANDALVRLIAKSLRLPKSAVDVVAGHKQRLKQVRITGDPDAVVGRLQELARK